MIRQDPLFKGCTRPAMFLGVPVVPLFVSVGIVVILSIWIKLLLLVVVLPIVLIMRLIVKKDDQQFRLLWLKFWCRVVPHINKNRYFWRASCYSPICFKKRGVRWWHKLNIFGK